MENAAEAVSLVEQDRKVQICGEYVRIFIAKTQSHSAIASAQSVEKPYETPRNEIPQSTGHSRSLSRTRSHSRNRIYAHSENSLLSDSRQRTGADVNVMQGPTKVVLFGFPVTRGLAEEVRTAAMRFGGVEDINTTGDNMFDNSLHSLIDNVCIRSILRPSTQRQRYCVCGTGQPCGGGSDATRSE